MSSRTGVVAARLRRAGQEPVRVALFLLHSGTLFASAALVVVQIQTDALRFIAALALGALALFALSSPGAGAGISFVIGTGLGYVVLTSFAGALVDDAPRPPPPAWQVLGLAAGLFCSHAIDAFRATIPPGASGDPDVLIRWVRRLAEALIPGLLLGALLLRVSTSDDSGALWILGGVGLIIVVGLPSLAARPRPWLRQQDDDGDPARSGSS